MSRIGNRKVVVPAGVTVTNENNVVTVKGPKGELSLDLVKGIEVNIEENTLTVTRPNDEKATKQRNTLVLGLERKKDGKGIRRFGQKRTDCTGDQRGRNPQHGERGKGRVLHRF